MAKGHAIKYTPEQLDYIKTNCSLERKELTANVNRIFGTYFTVDAIKSLCKRKQWNTGRTGHFIKDHKPWNTGTKGVCKPNSGNFQKGQITWNKKPVGYERICSKDGYVLIKVAEPNVFKLKHRVVWEQVNGAVPDGHIVAFKNMDRTDCRIENLMLMSKSEMARFNQSFKLLANDLNKESCLLMAKVKAKIHQVRRGEIQC
ncbi:HNH endonuclease signature motif containing protein [Acinetobacter soli]|uniref:HNH endonuclease signature motif containing protein n=1 Tax=Acinetobacter soli TaxID=487316 RepID=UPI00124DE083|nr:HNH endonuclease signature motif containing protein [Acinetobacter soli]